MYMHRPAFIGILIGLEACYSVMYDVQSQFAKCDKKTVSGILNRGPINEE